MSQSAQVEHVKENEAKETDVDRVSQREKDTIAETGARSALLSFHRTTSTGPQTNNDAIDASASDAGQVSRCSHGSDVPLHPWPQKSPYRLAEKAEKLAFWLIE